MDKGECRPRQSRVLVLLTAMGAFATFGTSVSSKPAFAADGGQDAKDSDRGQKVSLLDCPADENIWKLPPKGLYWKTLHKMLDEKAGQLIKVADRDNVDQALYLDIEGLRLYVPTPECLKTFKELPAESSERITSGYLIRNLLGRRHAETGIEPDRIPVRGSGGKMLGMSGMVLIKGGEYVRPGHYYTSQSAELGERHGEEYRVRVSSFYMDKYKVTNEEYCRFLNDGNSGYWNSATWSNIKRNTDEFCVDTEKAKWPVVAVNCSGRLRSAAGVPHEIIEQLDKQIADGLPPAPAKNRCRSRSR